jgi:hypothetical protein
LKGIGSFGTESFGERFWVSEFQVLEFQVSSLKMILNLKLWNLKLFYCSCDIIPLRLKCRSFEGLLAQATLSRFSDSNVSSIIQSPFSICLDVGVNCFLGE